MKTRLIEYFDNQTCLEGYLAFDETIQSPRPGVLVVHDWSGRNAHVEERAERLAKMGYVGFAVDMYGKGILGKNNEEKSKLATPFFNDRSLVKQRMLLALNILSQQPEVNKEKLATFGFCFGGLCSLDLARSGVNIQAAISFHGILTSPPSGCINPLKAKILALHGYDDPMITPENVLEFEKEMTFSKADWQIHVYGKTKHAFTNKLANDPNFGTVYCETADRRSWIAASNFLTEVLS